MIYDNLTRITSYQAIAQGMLIVENYLKNPMNDLHDSGEQDIGAGILLNIVSGNKSFEKQWYTAEHYIEFIYVLTGKYQLRVLGSNIANNPDYNIQMNPDYNRCMNLEVVDGEFVVFFPHEKYMSLELLNNGENDATILTFRIPTEERQYFEQVVHLCSKLALPSDASESVIHAARLISPDWIISIEKEYFADIDITSKIEELSVSLGITSAIGNMAVCMMLSLQTYYNYLDKNIPIEMFYDAMKDFIVWNNYSMRKTGLPGMEKIEWISQSLKERMYTIGRFQYAPTVFDHDEFRCGVHCIRRGDPVYTIHIPEGEPLTDEVRYESYRKAEKFFHTHIFVCRSWLLYDKHRTILPENSNIRAFMDDFSILSIEEQRGFYANLWRIFGYHLDYSDFSSFPENTGLQRAYKKHLIETGGMTGKAYGVIVIEDGNIISNIFN